MIELIKIKTFFLRLSVFAVALSQSAFVHTLRFLGVTGTPIILRIMGRGGAAIRGQGKLPTEFSGQRRAWELYTKSKIWTTPQRRTAARFRARLSARGSDKEMGMSG